MIDKEILDSVLPVPELEELKESTIKELEEEVLRLRQQRDAANAQLAFVLEKLSEE